MPEHDRAIGCAKASRRLDERQVLERERVAADEPCERRDAEHRNGHDDVRHAAAEDRDDADREQDAGEREQHVADPHDDPVPPAFLVAGDESEQRADDCADGHRQESRRERDPRAHQDAAEDVAAERIDAEPVLPRRARVERVVVEEALRVERDDPGRRDRDEHEQQHERTRDHRHLLPPELAPELRPRRAHALVGEQWRRGGHRCHQRYRIVGLIRP